MFHKTDWFEWCCGHPFVAYSLPVCVSSSLTVNATAPPLSTRLAYTSVTSKITTKKLRRLIYLSVSSYQKFYRASYPTTTVITKNFDASCTCVCVFVWIIKDSVSRSCILRRNQLHLIRLRHKFASVAVVVYSFCVGALFVLCNRGNWWWQQSRGEDSNGRQQVIFQDPKLVVCLYLSFTVHQCINIVTLWSIS